MIPTTSLQSYAKGYIHRDEHEVVASLIHSTFSKYNANTGTPRNYHRTNIGMFVQSCVRLFDTVCLFCEVNINTPAHMLTTPSLKPIISWKAKSKTVLTARTVAMVWEDKV